jgi:hypothetical protein
VFVRSAAFVAGKGAVVVDNSVDMINDEGYVPEEIAATPTWCRLESQINWYNSKSVNAQRQFRVLKLVELVVAALIPFLAGLRVTPWATGIAGVSVVVLEGIQSLGQYHSNWIAYRLTCENLRHERHLFLAGAGPYADLNDPVRLLAERVESLISEEHTKWVASRKESGRQRQ